MLTSPQDDRRRMVERQLKTRGIGNPHVLAAMGEVPREKFVPEQLREFAYEDGPLPIGEEQTISQPYIVALMIEAAGIQPGDRVVLQAFGSTPASSSSASAIPATSAGAPTCTGPATTPR